MMNTRFLSARFAPFGHSVLCGSVGVMAALAMASGSPDSNAQTVTDNVGSVSSAGMLLPDLFSWESATKEYMHGGFYDTTYLPGRTLYRFNVAIPNAGDGPFEVREETHANNTQDVYQRIYDSAGGISEQLIGTFDVGDSSFGHLSFVGLAQYNLREVASGGSAGEIVAEKTKTSHCLVDSVAYDLSLPDASPSRQYSQCGAPRLGVSVGWADLYSTNIDEQWIDVTGIADGMYWLEVIVDPDNRVTETNENNNVTQVLVDLVIPPPVPLSGDMDGDGDVDFDDVDFFVLGLADPQEYENQVGFPAVARGDTDADGGFDFDDIAGFVVLLSGSGVRAVPEPSTAILAVMGTIGCVLVTRYKAATK